MLAWSMSMHDALSYMNDRMCTRIALTEMNEESLARLPEINYTSTQLRDPVDVWFLGTLDMIFVN